MSKDKTIVCTTVPSGLLIVVDIYKCKSCGHEYAEVFDICNEYKRCPYCGAEVVE